MQYNTTASIPCNNFFSQNSNISSQTVVDAQLYEAKQFLYSLTKRQDSIVRYICFFADIPGGWGFCKKKQTSISDEVSDYLFRRHGIQCSLRTVQRVVKLMKDAGYLTIKRNGPRASEISIKKCLLDAISCKKLSTTHKSGICQNMGLSTEKIKNGGSFGGSFDPHTIYMNSESFDKNFIDSDVDKFSVNKIETKSDNLESVGCIEGELLRVGLTSKDRRIISSLAKKKGLDYIDMSAIVDRMPKSGIANKAAYLCTSINRYTDTGARGMAKHNLGITEHVIHIDERPEFVETKIISQSEALTEEILKRQGISSPLDEIEPENATGEEFDAYLESIGDRHREYMDKFSKTLEEVERQIRTANRIFH